MCLDPVGILIYISCCYEKYTLYSRNLREINRCNFKKISIKMRFILFGVYCVIVWICTPISLNIKYKSTDKQFYSFFFFLKSFEYYGNTVIFLKDYIVDM